MKNKKDSRVNWCESILLDFKGEKGKKKTKKKSIKRRNLAAKEIYYSEKKGSEQKLVTNYYLHI